jgi:hypothetical protein
MQPTLFTLPLELREQIYTHAFGNLTLHPRKITPPPSPTTLRLFRLSFDPCIEPLTDHQIYTYDLAPPNSPANQLFHAANEQAREVGRFIGSHEHCHAMNREGNDLPIPFVCKQMYREAVPVVWRTSTFAFSHGSQFRRFLMAPTVRHDLVTQICIYHTAGPDRAQGWCKTLADPSLPLEKLTRLEGLNLVHVWWGMEAFNPLKGKQYFEVLKAVVERFKGKGLKEEGTTVFLHPHNTSMAAVPREIRQGVAREVRRALLE